VRGGDIFDTGVGVVRTTDRPLASGEVLELKYNPSQAWWEAVHTPHPWWDSQGWKK
jgi:hypothetical protein